MTACEICHKTKENDVLPDGSQGIESVLKYTYTSSNRIESPYYIL